MILDSTRADPDSGTARHDQAAVRLMDHADAIGVLGRISVADRAAAVGRTIVHKHEFKVIPGLPQSRLETFY